jgi:small subunit ribosomal protein S20
MANIASAKKRARQAEKHRLLRASQRSALRTSIKKVVAAVRSGDQEKARAAYSAAVPVIDSAVNKRLIHANKAARSKSQLNARIRAMQAA